MKKVTQFVLFVLVTLSFSSFSYAINQDLERCRILLGSGGFSGSSITMEYFVQSLDRYLGPTIDEVLVIPYASVDNPMAAVNTIKTKSFLGSRKVESITSFADPKGAIAQAKSIVVWGGNTFVLLDTLYKLDLLNILRERVNAGVPYIGVSAGTGIVAPTIKTTNDMPIVWPASLEALGLVPFQINAHYFRGNTYEKIGENEYKKHAGETRDERIEEFHKRNDTVVLGLPEATFLSVTQGQMVINSHVPTAGRLFRKGHAPTDLSSGVDISSHLDP